jgi:hypothetical protein
VDWRKAGTDGPARVQPDGTARTQRSGSLCPSFTNRSVRFPNVARCCERVLKPAFRDISRHLATPEPDARFRWGNPWGFTAPSALLATRGRGPPRTPATDVVVASKTGHYH